VPNIIVELTQEKNKVRELLPYLDSLLRHEGERSIRIADDYMVMNDMEGMKDALDILRLFMGANKRK
jgi:hypothetical protein